MIIIRWLKKVTGFSKVANTRNSVRRSEGRCLMLLSPLLAFRSPSLWSVFHRWEVKEFLYYEISQHYFFFLSETSYIWYLLVFLSYVLNKHTDTYIRAHIFIICSLWSLKDEDWFFPQTLGKWLMGTISWVGKYGLFLTEESALYYSMNKYFKNP